MLNTDQASADQIIVHYAGLKSLGEPPVLSETGLDLSDEFLSDTLISFFLKPFKEPEYYQFELKENRLPDVYKIAEEIFEKPETFEENSRDLCRRLYEISDHPAIKAGELFVVKLRDFVVDDELTDGIGIFKAENKSAFLQILKNSNQLSVSALQGISATKPDKGCLIFNTEKEFGYKVCLYDTANKTEAGFWKKTFLQVTAREDDFYHTRNVMEVCADFIDEVYNTENEVSMPEQIAMKSRAVQYFETKEQFDPKEFEIEVIREPEVIDAFREYKTEVSEEREIDLPTQSFPLSEKAVKSEKKAFKRIIKLDKNFHVYVHGDNQMISKGFDAEKQMHFYQLYFREEK